MRKLAAFLSQHKSQIELFFRDDDAGWADAELFAMLDLFEERQLPVDLAVIPAALQSRLAEELNARRESHHGLGLHQHGYAHVNYEAAGNRKCEFGPARPISRQLADVVAGRERMSAFLPKWDPIFTPPWNRCSDMLVSALAGHGFALFSADRSRGGSPANIAQLPVTLDWERAKREDRLEQTLIDLFAGANGPVGIMLHHAEMDNAARAELASMLDVIGDCAMVSAHPMRRWIMEERR